MQHAMRAQVRHGMRVPLRPFACVGHIRERGYHSIGLVVVVRQAIKIHRDFRARDESIRLRVKHRFALRVQPLHAVKIADMLVCDERWEGIYLRVHSVRRNRHRRHALCRREGDAHRRGFVRYRHRLRVFVCVVRVV